MSLCRARQYSGGTHKLPSELSFAEFEKLLKSSRRCIVNDSDQWLLLGLCVTLL
jgi:hypothetical protein